MLCGAGSVKVRLKAMSAGQSRCRSPAGPWPAWARARSTTSAALTSTFFGSQPRSVQVPPYSRRSTMATRLPPPASASATVCPATPVPMTMTSKSLMIFSHPCARRGCTGGGHRRSLPICAAT